MPAIITQDFRKFNAANFMDKMLGPNPDVHYYMGIGKPNPWTTPQFMPMPTSGAAALDDVRNNLIATKAIRTGATDSDVSFGRMIPNIKYVQGRKYKFYDSSDDSCWYPTVDGTKQITHWPCYVVKDGAVWLVLRNRPADQFNSNLEAPDEFVTVTPSGDAFSDTNGLYTEEVSGYVFGKLCVLNTSGRFLDTDEFIQIDDCEKIDVSGGEPFWSTGIYSGKVNDEFIDELDGIITNGDGSTSEATDRVVFKAFNELPINTNLGYDYKFENSVLHVKYVDNANSAIPIADINFDEGTLDSVRATSKYTTSNHPFEFVNIHFTRLPKYSEMEVADIVKMLPSWYIGFNTQISTANGEVPDDISYRQISILSVNSSDLDSVIDPSRGTVSPNAIDDQLVADSITIISLNLAPDNVEEILSPGDIIYGAGDSKAIFVRYYDEDGPKMKIIQNKETGLNPLGGALTYGSERSPRRIVNGTSNVSVGQQFAPEFVADERTSVLFVENTSPLSRNNIQIEDLKVIIQF